MSEIPCSLGEAINPKRNLPRAVMGTILIVTVLYVLAAIALVGMVPYEEVSVMSGFPDGFRWRGLEWAAQISAVSDCVKGCQIIASSGQYLNICVRIAAWGTHHFADCCIGNNHGSA